MSDRLRVLHVIGSLELGGTERQLVDLLCHLDPARFDGRVVCLGGRGPLASVLDARGIAVHALEGPGLRWRDRPLDTARYLGRLVTRIRRARPDVVHGHLFWGYVLGAYAARLARVRRVVAGRRSLSRFRVVPRRSFLLLERGATKLTDVIVANSDAVREDAIREEGAPPEKIRVIHNGLDLVAFDAAAREASREAFDLPAGAPVVLVVANLIHYKGHAVFLDAWRRVRERHPAALAVLVGEGPLRADLEGRVAVSGLTSAVRFAGARTDVPAWLSVSDLVVHPSLTEGFPNAVLEAMAAGRAIVATAVGGTPEAIDDERHGLLVPPGDPDALAAAIARCLDDAALRTRLGGAARRRVEGEFSMDRTASRYAALYEALAGGNREAR